MVAIKSLLAVLPILATAPAVLANHFILSHKMLVTTRLDPIVNPGGLSGQYVSAVTSSRFPMLMMSLVVVFTLSLAPHPSIRLWTTPKVGQLVAPPLRSPRISPTTGEFATFSRAVLKLITARTIGHLNCTITTRPMALSP